METAPGFEPLQLRPIQYIPGAPNTAKNAIDWIPDFAGFGWLAYGAGPVVVITAAQPPKSNQNKELEVEEGKIGPVFQQILQPSGDEEEDIRAVAWAPVVPSDGALAVGVGECVYVYDPRSLVAGAENSILELPLAWEQVKVLSHSSRVHAVVWTESGDGLLVAGYEVTMWRKRDSGWDSLWKSQVSQPHFLASAMWSAVGLAATAADGSTCEGGPWTTPSNPFMGSSKGQVIVWHWNDVGGLQETELSHPQPVSMIQWRPQYISCFQRQVLLTCCLDGAVRLWIEIDSRRAKLDKVLGKETADKHVKATFFVGAVIEVNQCLNGILGTNISLVWARETRSSSVQNRERVEPSCFNEVFKGNSVGSCEWLLGVGPNASLAWWSLHCLDDVSPPRCPRVYLWKQGTDLLPQRLKLPLLGGYSSSQACSLLVKAFVQRIDRKLSAPPSSADLFELIPENIFSWSRVEVPMSTAGLGDFPDETTNSNEDDQNNLCGITSEILNQGGHSGRVVQVALHPVIEVELAASLDSNGHVLIWSLGTLVEPQIEIPTFLHNSWKISGQLPDCKISKQNKYCFLTWVPLVLKESRLLLFVGHSQGFDCVFITKESTGREITVHHEMACTVQLPDALSLRQLECIHATVLAATSAENCIKYSIMVLGLENGGQMVALWKIRLHVQHDGEIPLKQLSEYFYNTEINLSKKDCYISVEACLPKFVNSGDLAQVTSIAVMPTGCQVIFCQQSEGPVPSASDNSPAYNLVTCHFDGVVKLWKVSDLQESPVPDCQTGEVLWICVGLIKIPNNAAVTIALENSGSKIATASSMNSDEGTTINIWDAESYLGEGDFILEDIISLPARVTALDWLTIGNGQLLLGVAMQNEVRVYAQKRHISDTPLAQGETRDLHIWFCIASFCSTFSIRDLSWGPKATLVVVSSKLVCIVSQWAYTAKRKIQELNENESALVCLDSHSSQSGKSSKATSSSLSTNGDVKKCSSMAFGVTTEHNPLHIRGSMQSLLGMADQIGGPLPVYHPSAVIHCLLTGNRKRAVASLRHLMVHLSFDGSGISQKASKDFQEHFHSIPQADLPELLQVGLRESNDGRDIQWGIGMDFAISTSSHTWNQSGASHPTEGCRLMKGQNTVPKDHNDTFSKSEVEGFVTALAKFPRVPGITDDERIHLFAVLDLLAEISSSYKAAQYENLDNPARRFWIWVHFRRLYFKRKMGRDATVEDLTVDSSTLAWACQTDCQDMLLDLCLLDELSWPLMRNLGVGFWFTDVTSLRSRMEKLARAQYLKRKDPRDCALLYMALNRRNVLLGLFKLSKDGKDKPLVAFLARNFQEEKNKSAALKNAYVLKGRHQYELAVAFFLLGDDPNSAVSVCAKDLGDEQLALVICRLVEGSNGPLAQDLMSKHILPIAEGKKDYWLASLVQWFVGNPVKSFQQLIQPSRVPRSMELGMQVENPFSRLDNVVHRACLDSNRAQYCAMLAMKNSLKARIGESKCTALARWATMKTSSALKRSGLPLEALECLSSSTSFLLKEGFERLSVIGSHEDFFGKCEINKIADIKIHSISGSLAGKVESIHKLNLATQYMSKIIISHPYWGCIYPVSYKLIADVCGKNKDNSQYHLLLKESDQKLSKNLSILDQKYSIQTADVLQALANFGYHHGRLFCWCYLLHYTTVYPENSQKAFQVSKSPVFPSTRELLHKVIGETSNALAHVVLACGYNMSSLKAVFIYSGDLRYNESDCVHCLPKLTEFLRISNEMKFLAYFVTSEVLHSEEQQKLFKILDLLTLGICVAFAWLRRDARTLLPLSKTIMLTDIDSSSQEFDIGKRYEQLYSVVDQVHQYAMENSAAKSFNDNPQQENAKQEKSSVQVIDNDCRWRLVGVCLWIHLKLFVKKQFTNVSSVEAINNFCPNAPLKSPATQLSVCSSSLSDSFGKADMHSEPSSINMEGLEMSLVSTLACISAGLIRQFTWYLRQNLRTMPQNPILLWLCKMSSSLKKKSQNRFLGDMDRHGGLEFENTKISNSLQGVDALLTDGNSSDEYFQQVWKILVNHKEVATVLKSEGFTVSESTVNGGVSDWSHSAKEIEGEESIENTMTENQRAAGDNKTYIIRSKLMESTVANLTSNDNSILGRNQRMACGKEKTYTSFQKPKEVLRKNGELFEAICVNSCNPDQVVVASNRKGLIYLNLTTEEQLSDSFEYLWSNAEWPSNGWAGSQSTPVPTFVSPGVGLGSKEGSSIGLGGATVGLGPLPRSGKDLSGVTFGIPGYAGIGAMGLGWGEWEDFEGFIDPPATAENVNTRALASHPLRPLFLVGSSNTHVYLWEFGKVTAIATYGVLPAANVPPPYALASVSAVQFDRYGHRFATAALDGTVSAWQLEVGGRSNVRPTESSLCFHQHASDVAFIGASGSILGATGFSPNGQNMVIWDTLAPPAASRVSLGCHEGGARSLAVFDHDIGSGSISPLIVTGGKGGDIAVHDFRFITTGKTKHQKHPKEENMLPSSPLRDTGSTKDTSGLRRKVGEQNSNGMVWYIPKAHLGSISRISTVPGTSLFLTGSKDGDVKLWDVKTFELLHHWHKIHDKHTFLQPNSRGFGGVVRAAVTDVQVLPYGFFTCGGDGAVKLFCHTNEISYKET